MSSPAPVRRIAATLLLVAGGLASVATSEPQPETGGDLQGTADGPVLVLGTASQEAFATVTIALDEEAMAIDGGLIGGVFVDASACVSAEDAPARLRVSLVPEQPIEGSVLEKEVPACPSGADFHLDLFSWNSCIQGEACAERYELRFEHLGPATTASSMTIVFAASASASAYDDDFPAEGSELTVVIE